MDSLRLVEPSDGGADEEQALFDRDRYAPPFDRPEAPARGWAPSVPPMAIRRARLERLLDRHPERRVVLVRGPAGAGKTVLVAQWVRAQPRPCAWLSIDAAPYGADRLGRQLAQALHRLSPGAVDHTVAASRARGGLDHVVLGEAVRAVSDDLGTSIVLVVDDVHRLRDPAARQVLGQLVEHPPEAARIVLIARAKPCVRLARARLRGDLVEVTPAALAFDRAEIATLAGSWTGPSLGAAELEQSTLGWTAGLRLAHLEASSDDGAFGAPGDADRIAFEYVGEELLDPDHADAGAVGSFLAVSCWLPVLTDPLRLAVAGQDRDRPAPSWQDLEALPIQPIASRPGAFRYPPILRRVVQMEYRRRDPQAADAARRRAAEASWQAGELATALELFLQLGRSDEAARVCAELAERDESSLSALDELLRRDPEAVAGAAPLLPWRIRAAVAAGHVDEGRAMLDQADRAARSTDPPPAEDVELVTARAILAERAGEAAVLSACVDVLLPTTDGVAAVPLPDRQARRAHGWRVRTLVWSGDVVGARAALRELEPLAAGPDPEAAADVTLAGAWLAWLDGDIARTTEAVAAARSGGEGRAEHAAQLELLAGSGHRERNQVGKATLLLQGARALAEASAHRVVAALAASELARCHRTAGAGMEALALVVSARAAHADLPPAVDAHLRATEVLVRLDQGDVAGARAVLHDAPPGTDSRLLAARIDLHEGTAPTLLDAVDAHTSRQAVDALLLRSRLPGLDEAEADAALLAAISAAEPLGLVRTFLDEGPTLSHRLQRLALRSPERSLGRLAALAAQQLSLGPASEGADPVDQLTSRELAVVRMLPLRMSNREMAAQLYISVNTLKTHIRSIYRKLDVPHRSAAVQRARALQLV